MGTTLDTEYSNERAFGVCDGAIAGTISASLEIEGLYSRSDIYLLWQG